MNLFKLIKKLFSFKEEGFTGMDGKVDTFKKDESEIETTPFTYTPTVKKSVTPHGTRGIRGVKNKRS